MDDDEWILDRTRQGSMNDGLKFDGEFYLNIGVHWIFATVFIEKDICNTKKGEFKTLRLTALNLIPAMNVGFQKLSQFKDEI